MTEDSNSTLERIVDADQALEQLLTEHAEAGVPELVLVGMLRDYAELIEEVGYVPRTWRNSITDDAGRPHSSLRPTDERQDANRVTGHGR